MRKNLAKTKLLVRPVLPTKIISVYVLPDLQAIIVKTVGTFTYACAIQYEPGFKGGVVVDCPVFAAVNEDVR